MEKDHYTILGVSRGASPQAIRKAYLARLRVIHPDRFDAKEQPEEWMLANEMLRELNDAYAKLKDTTSKVSSSEQHNNSYSGAKSQSSGSGSTHSHGFSNKKHSTPTETLSRVTSGSVLFRKLPTGIANKFRDAMYDDTNKTIELTGVDGLEYLLYPGIIWLFVVLAKIYETRGGAFHIFFSSINYVDFICFFCLWRGLYWFVRKFSPPGNLACLTPMYFVLCIRGEVRYCPIWKISDIKYAKKNNGEYKIIIQCDGPVLVFSVDLIGSIENFVDEIFVRKSAVSRLTLANVDSFIANNDVFQGVNHGVYGEEAWYGSPVSFKTLFASGFILFLGIFIISILKPAHLIFKGAIF